MLYFLFESSATGIITSAKFFFFYFELFRCGLHIQRAAVAGTDPALGCDADALVAARLSALLLPTNPRGMIYLKPGG